MSLTDHGRQTARMLQPVLARQQFVLVVTSPLQRARETCELAGLGKVAVIEPDLMEWNYGEYEGLTTKQIQSAKPGWSVFHHGSPSGETPEQVAGR
ncbi:MAG: histidine phosphatase family protein, partial [Candidatus Binatia bacterium]